MIGIDFGYRKATLLAVKIVQRPFRYTLVDPGSE